jgi:hypothetical protein
MQTYTSYYNSSESTHAHPYLNHPLRRLFPFQGTFRSDRFKRDIRVKEVFPQYGVAGSAFATPCLSQQEKAEHFLERV